MGREEAAVLTALLVALSTTLPLCAPITHISTLHDAAPADLLMRNQP